MKQVLPWNLFTSGGALHNSLSKHVIPYHDWNYTLYLTRLFWSQLCQFERTSLQTLAMEWVDVLASTPGSEQNNEFQQIWKETSEFETPEGGIK